MSKKYLAAALLAGLLIVAAAFIAVGSGDAYEFNGGEIKPAKAAAPISLTDQNGHPFTLDQLKGNVVLVYFGYTTCPDLCPTTLSDFTAVKDALGTDASKVKFVMVTVDPERDSPARMNEYLNFFDPEFIGLSGNDEQTETVKLSYGVVSRKVEYPDSATKYLVDHTSLIYVIDRDGKFRLTYPYGTDPDLIVTDLEHLAK